MTSLGIMQTAYSTSQPRYHILEADRIFLNGTELFPGGAPPAPGAAIVSFTLPGGAPTNVITAVADLTATVSALSTSDTYTDAAVKAAIDGVVAALQVKINTAINAVEQNVLNLGKKINDDLAAERAYGVIAP